MGKMSSADRMRIQTLREQGCGVKVIVAAYPQIYWKLSTLRKISKHRDWMQGWQWLAEICMLGHRHHACWGTHMFPRRTERPRLEHPWDCR